MTYPKTILNSKIRKAINIFLILSFFIISPIVILYTAGYRYDLKTGDTIQTGVIGVDVKPNTAKVFLNNIEIKKKIPIRVTNLAPDFYSIRIELDGYYTWSKYIDVKSKKSTFISNVWLYKKSTPTSILNSFKNTANVEFSPDGKYALLTTKENGIYEVKIYETSSKQISTITRTTNEREPQTSWSPFGNSAYIKITDSTRTTIYLLSATIPDNTNSFLFDTKSLDNNIQWKNSALPAIFIKENHEIKQLGLTGEKIISLNLNVDNWFVDEKNDVWSVDNNKKTLKMVSGTEDSIPYSLNQTDNKIIDIDSKRAILTNQNETTIIKLNTRESVGIKTSNFTFSQYSNSWLTWSPLEIWEIWESGDYKLVNRTSEIIKTANPLDKYGVLLLTSENYIKTFDTNYLLSQKLLENVIVKKISINQKDKKIFFWGIIDGEENFFELEY